VSYELSLDARMYKKKIEWETSTFVYYDVETTGLDTLTLHQHLMIRCFKHVVRIIIIASPFNYLHEQQLDDMIISIHIALVLSISIF
jgi:uncharacterized protein YprB with RNaseH-like and TPR domain